MSSRAFKTVIDIDLVGTFHSCRAAYLAWMREHGGRVVNITATLAYRGDPLQAHAGPAKAAIDALCRHLSREWGPDRVRINCVAPGPIDDTEGIRRLGGFLPDHILEPAKRRTIPLGRFGRKHEIADAVLFLVGEGAAYVTGTVLVVDGGAWMGGLTDAIEAAMDAGEPVDGEGEREGGKGDSVAAAGPGSSASATDGSGVCGGRGRGAVAVLAGEPPQPMGGLATARTQPPLDAS